MKMKSEDIKKLLNEFKNLSAENDVPTYRPVYALDVYHSHPCELVKNGFHSVAYENLGSAYEAALGIMINALEDDISEGFLEFTPGYKNSEYYKNLKEEYINSLLKKCTFSTDYQNDISIADVKEYNFGEVRYAKFLEKDSIDYDAVMCEVNFDIKLVMYLSFMYSDFKQAKCRKIRYKDGVAIKCSIDTGNDVFHIILGCRKAINNKILVRDISGNPDALDSEKGKIRFRNCFDLMYDAEIRDFEIRNARYIINHFEKEFRNKFLESYPDAIKSIEEADFDFITMNECRELINKYGKAVMRYASDDNSIISIEINRLYLEDKSENSEIEALLNKYI